VKVIMLGAGGVTRELLARLSEMWEATVVDVSVEELERLGTSRPLTRLQGDGSSRLVLERAGLYDADAMIAATNDDGANLEACRLAREAGIRRLAAVLRDNSYQAAYQQLEVPFISPAHLGARAVESHLERRRVSSTAFADGRAEAIEFHVAPDSPVCGKSLGELHAQSFVIGAILRGDRLIVPHGDTVLCEDDLVTVVGAGADFAGIVRTFTGGEQRFPLGFGTRVAVALDGEPALQGAFAEALHLVRNSRATSLLLVHRDPDSLRDPAQADSVRELLKRAAADSEGVALATRPVQGKPSRALDKLPGEESVGVIVVPAPRGHGFSALTAALRAVSLARRVGRPVLLSRSTQPYRRILIPARRTPAGRAAIRAGIDLAKLSGGSLLGAIVSDPVFISGPGDPVADRGVLSWIEEEAAVHGVGIESVVRRGNPVRLLVELGANTDLVVLGIATGARRLSQRERIAELVARRTDRSVLILPAAK